MIINLSIKKKVFIKPKFTQTKSKDFNSLPYTERMYLSGSKILNWIHIGPIKEALYLSNIEKKDHCLDIGSSEGILLPSLNEYSGNSVGIDINLQYLQRAKGLKLKNVNIINANIFHLPFKENSFTKIFCLDILEHVTNQNTAIKETKRVLNNNGICIIDLPVEFGFSLLLKQLFASIFKFPRDKYSKTEKGIWRKILTTPNLRAVVIFFTLDAFIYSVSLSIYSAGLINQYHITTQDIALLALCSNISLMLFQIPAGHLTDKIGRKKTLILCELFGLTFFSLLVIAFFLWSSGFERSLLPLLIIGQIINAAVATTFIPSEGVTLTNLDETRRAESYGIVSLIRGIGVIPTGVIAGFLIQDVHYIAPFIFTIIGISFLLWFLLSYFQE